jgi:hypothetical protein
LIVTLLISSIVFVPIPYIPGLIIALPSGRFDPNLLAFASAIGVTLGRTTIFLASYRGRSLIKKGNINSDDPFVASLTPFLPDDHYYTPGYFQICSMEICCDNLPWKVYNQFGGGVDTSTLGKATALLDGLASSCNLFEIQPNSARTIRI